MVWNPGDIREGMQVIGLDGAEVGTVVAVYHAGQRGDVADEPDRMAHGAARGPMDVEASSDIGAVPGHFVVEATRQFDGARFYIPFDAVQILFPGENVTLSCTGEECGELYARRPIAPVGAP